MKIQHSLGVRKFNSIVLASIIEMIVDVLVSLVDIAVTGHIIGENGLSAMNVIAPITGLTVFTQGMFPIGTSMIYARHMADFKKKEADGIFGMGLICSWAVGVLTFFAILLLLPYYLDFMGIQATVRSLIESYMRFLIFELMLSAVFELISTMVVADGNEYLSMASNIAQPVLNIGLSIWLGRLYGMAGIGMGSLISTVAAFLILIPHFLSKRCSLRPRVYFSLKDLKKMILFGWNEECMFVFLPVMFFIVTKFMIANFGERWLPVLTVLSSIIELTVLFEATGEGMRPILSIYLRDENAEKVRELTLHSQKLNLLLGIGFGLVIFVAAPYIPLLFDIEDRELINVCIFGLRIYAVGAPAASMMAFLNSYYLNIGKTGAALVEMLLMHLFAPVAMMIPVSLLIGIRGIFVGYALAAYFALLVFLVYIILRFGKKGFPFYFQNGDYKILNIGIALEADQIEGALERLNDFLKDNSVPSKTAMNMQVLFEDTTWLIKEKNTGKTVYAEWFIKVTDGYADMSVWDSGEIFDITDSDMKLDNFREYVVSRYMDHTEIKKHIVTTSFNRNAFQFDVDRK